MRLIKIDKLLFASALIQLQSTVNSVNVSYAGWETQGENSAVFDSYIEGFLQLHAIMQSYQKLVNKDILAMRSIGNELNEMDLRIKQLWK